MAQWREVKGYEGLYLVTDTGKVFSTSKNVTNGRGEYIRNGRFLSPSLRGKDGIMYQFVKLSKNGQTKSHSVHRIVAEAFIENPNGFNVINHKDRNTLNNNCDNLEWCNQQYNNEYSHNKRISQFLDGEKIAEYKSISYASKMTQISRTAINNVLTGWSKTAGGYEWKYTE